MTVLHSALPRLVLVKTLKKGKMTEKENFIKLGEMSLLEWKVKSYALASEFLLKNSFKDIREDIHPLYIKIIPCEHWVKDPSSI